MDSKYALFQRDMKALAELEDIGVPEIWAAKVKIMLRMSARFADLSVCDERMFLSFAKAALAEVLKERD